MMSFGKVPVGVVCVLIGVSGLCDDIISHGRMVYI